VAVAEPKIGEERASRSRVASIQSEQNFFAPQRPDSGPSLIGKFVSERGLFRSVPPAGYRGPLNLHVLVAFTLSPIDQFGAKTHRRR